ncbi:PDR/VanB family oxidoreductase [Nakamurella leprariae]|uniref:Oxidoreductase n=1 Tax=Nakamurella leprariae TaxID=2803911 RepID=A0A938YBN3_9ACTN|nr:PDR/VanB family oxidoreductase [Nakamurella leprariae]MBM9469530.1 oxidoreductase [Nakamurella leprariae]
MTVTDVTHEAAAGRRRGGPVPTQRLRIAQVRWEAEEVVSVTVAAPDGEPLPAWSPGAHIDLHLPVDDSTEPLIRSYSLCGDPAAGEWTVAVRLDAASRGGSRHVHERLRVGDMLTVVGPRQLFELEPAAEYVFVAGGIGITPLLPMIEQADAEGRPWRLVYAGSRRDSMPFRRRLHRHGDRIELYPSAERRVDLAALLTDLAPGTLVYCCGPERMLAAVSDAVAGTIAAESLRTERFRPREIVTVTTDADGATTDTDHGADTGAAVGGFEVELGTGGQVLPVPADTSLLDVLLGAGCDIMWSCREGTCGSCETGVLAGVPEHRDSVLTPDEQEANDVMFPCISRSRTSRLTLDL